MLFFKKLITYTLCYALFFMNISWAGGKKHLEMEETSDGYTRMRLLSFDSDMESEFHLTASTRDTLSPRSQSESLSQTQSLVEEENPFEQLYPQSNEPAYSFYFHGLELLLEHVFMN